MAILFGRDQLPVIISFFVCGVLSGMICDLFRIKRRIFGAPYAVVFVDDVLFMLCNAVIFIINEYSFNNGNIKWYEAPVMLAGFIVYRFTFSVIFIKICFAFIDLIKRLIRRILSPLKKYSARLCGFIAKLLERFTLSLNTRRKRRMIEKAALFDMHFWKKTFERTEA